jgi:hypothetical protein
MVAIAEKRSQPKVDTKVDASEIIYPSSDGEPLAETQQHVRQF